MSIPVVDIAADDVRKILRLEEGHFHDLKAIEVKPAKLTTLISAYANADGGEVFIGVDEDKSTGIRSWRGLPSQEAANPHLQVFEELFPLGQDFDYEFLRPLSGQLGLVLHVSIRKTREIVTSSDGTPYVRRGAQSLPVRTPEALRELTGIGSENKVKSIFLRLAEAKQIERVPGKGGGSAAWRKYTGRWEESADIHEAGTSVPAE
jgi:ATP-dependent DNA helicase RecG